MWGKGNPYLCTVARYVNWFSKYRKQRGPSKNSEIGIAISFMAIYRKEEKTY